jgi:hypothetical protein
MNLIEILFQKELLQSGSTVQLLSKNSGHLLQVVMSSNGTLVFDGNGATNSFNSKTFQIEILKVSFFFCSSNNLK